MFFNVQNQNGQNGQLGEYRDPFVNPNSYTVQRGDNLTTIARRFNTTVSALASLNGISNINLIRVGQVLRIPSGAVVPVTPVTPTTPKPPGVPPSLTDEQKNNKSTGTPPGEEKKEEDKRSWFDKTFFDGAGKLTATGIGILVLGAVIVAKRK